MPVPRLSNQKNDVLTVTGMVTAKRVEEGENRVYLDIDVINQTGASTCPGHAIVVLPKTEILPRRYNGPAGL